MLLLEAAQRRRVGSAYPQREHPPRLRDQAHHQPTSHSVHELGLGEPGSRRPGGDPRRRRVLPADLSNPRRGVVQIEGGCRASEVTRPWATPETLVITLPLKTAVSMKRRRAPRLSCCQVALEAKSLGAK